VVTCWTRDSRQVRARRRTTSGVEPIEAAGVRAPRVRPTSCARVPLGAGVIRSGASLVLCSPFGRGEPVPHGRGARRNRGCDQRIHPIGSVPPAKAGVEVAFIHPTAWNRISANLAFTEFSEVQLGDTERLSVRRVMSSSCSQPSPVKEDSSPIRKSTSILSWPCSATSLLSLGKPNISPSGS
jgi:hypothetical protein